TVSRTFARPGRVNAVTAARVRAVADELGYRANPIARALSTSKTRMVALMVSDVANPFYSELIHGAQLAAGEEGYLVLLADAQESSTLERTAIERLIPVVDGILIASPRMSDSGLRTIAKQIPLIVLNRELTDVPCVVTDNAAGMRAAVEHLHDLGHTSITYVAGPEASWADGARWRALRDVSAELGVHAHRIGPFPPTFQGGLDCEAELLAHPITAAICYNDLIAIGVMAALRRAGLRVPSDVSVIGFDDILTARLVSPPLTTVAAPMRYMGATSVRNLVALARGAHSRSGRAWVLPVRLKVRGSTAQRRRRRNSPGSGATRIPESAP
ncbi:MAG TPA: LacI family DNA-binding transcriptional regulator, partial [Propionibacteriaceae bacterium]|nr:LacI family DNA-binding transcriptional regulator [Propionibacteriaceae bacterium]